MNLVAVPVADLRPDPLNARKHDEENVEAIMRSLAQFGQAEPLVRNARTGFLIGGHGRLDAMKRLGWTEAKVVDLDLDETKARALGVALNQTATLAEWDEARLASLLHDFDADDQAATGFDGDEVDDLIRDYWSEDGSDPFETNGMEDPDQVPVPPVDPVARTGDLYVLGKHRLLCGDSTSKDDVARLLDGATPEFLVTDPPYGVSFDAEWRDRAGLNECGPAEPSYMQRAEGHQNTTISGDTIADWSHAFELVPSLRVAYVWHASSYSVDVGAGLRRIGFDLRQQIIWRKPHFVLSRTHYHYQTEPCWYAVRKGATAAWVGTRDQSNLWDAASPKMLMNPGGVSADEDGKFDHPTQKPMLCMERPISNHDLADVYEPFAGSGTTLIACERQRRRCFAMELDPKYVDVIVARWERFTGKKAVRNPCDAA